MKYFQISALIIGTLILAGACSAGQRNQQLGVVCLENLDPIPMVVPESDKLVLDSNVPPGDYVYAGAKLYFIDDQTDFRILVNDSQLRTGEFSASVGCVRNVKPGMENDAWSVPGVSKLQVFPGNKFEFEVKDYGFKIEDTRIQAQVQPLTEGKPQSPKEVYEGVGATNTFVYKPVNNNGNIEIRSTGKVNGGTYYLLVAFQRQELK